jgi:hypothetical protein
VPSVHLQTASQSFPRWFPPWFDASRPGPSLPPPLGKPTAHGLRNALHFRLKELHRLVQCSRFSLARDQKYPCLLSAGASGRMLSSRIPDELKLVAQPVGHCRLLLAVHEEDGSRVRICGHPWCLRRWETTSLLPGVQVSCLGQPTSGPCAGYLVHPF